MYTEVCLVIFRFVFKNFVSLKNFLFVFLHIESEPQQL